MDSKEVRLKLKYQEILSLWKEFCNSHTKLYELTCEEYMHLLSSDMDKLEETIDFKQDLIEHINRLDDTRQTLMQDVASINGKGESINSVSRLLQVMQTDKDKSFSIQLDKYNKLLLDIVEKIQDQNKTNQLFLNKAILSLQELKDSFNGNKSFKTYNDKGISGNNAST